MDLDTLVSAFFWPSAFHATLRRELANIQAGRTHPRYYQDAIRNQFATRLAHEKDPYMKLLVQQVLDGLDSQK